MNREIRFRGLRVDGKGWIYGSFVFPNNILLNDMDVYKVNSKTVGQFTGLIDKNGNAIYEGDYDENHDVVSWCDRKLGWALKAYNFPTEEFVFCHCYDCEGNFELSETKKEVINIIGNIYENK